MKKNLFAVVIAILALTASVNVNAQSSASFNQVQNDEFVLNQIASELSFDNAYNYTILCQRYICQAKQIKESVRLTEAQKQNRIESLRGIYTDRFSTLLDSWQTEATLAVLSAE